MRQQKTAREKLGEAEAGKRRAEAARESSRAEVDGETDEEIPARIAAAAHRAQAEVSLQHCERKLAEIGDGGTIAALDTEVAAIAADLLDSELARLQLESEFLTQDREEAAAEEQRLAAELRQIESGGRKGAASAPGPDSRRDGGGHAKKFAPVNYLAQIPDPTRCGAAANTQLARTARQVLGFAWSPMLAIEPLSR